MQKHVSHTVLFGLENTVWEREPLRRLRRHLPHTQGRVSFDLDSQTLPHEWGRCHAQRDGGGSLHALALLEVRFHIRPCQPRIAHFAPDEQTQLIAVVC